MSSQTKTPTDPPEARGGAPELDPALVARARSGDEGACRALVMRYQRPVFALLSRMLAARGRQDLIEDLAQETFLKVFKHLPGFDPSGPARLSTWILTIATRLAIDELRRGTLSVVPLDAGQHALAASGSADKLAERRALGKAIESAVDALGPEYRAVFVLCAYHHLSYKEISDALGCDLGTVKSRLSRARSALRQALQEVHHG